MNYNQLFINCIQKLYDHVTVNAIGEFSVDGIQYKVDAENDMNQCWMLVEKMEAEEWRYVMDNPKGNKTRFAFYQVEGEHEINVEGSFSEAIQDTPQKAIILACAKALGVE
jgi:hypothetical protein